MKKKLKDEDGLILAGDIFRSMTNKDLFCFFKTRPHPIAQTSLKLTSSSPASASIWVLGLKAWTTKPGQDNLNLTNLSSPHRSQSIWPFLSSKWYLGKCCLTYCPASHVGHVFSVLVLWEDLVLPLSSEKHTKGSWVPGLTRKVSRSQGFWSTGWSGCVEECSTPFGH